MQEMFDASWHIPKNINTGKVETEKVKNSNTSVIAKGSIPLYQIQEESHVAKINKWEEVDNIHMKMS